MFSGYIIMWLFLSVVLYGTETWTFTLRKQIRALAVNGTDMNTVTSSGLAVLMKLNRLFCMYQLVAHTPRSIMKHRLMVPWRPCDLLTNCRICTASRTALGPTQPPIQWVLGALSLEVKRPGCEADHSSPSSAEVKECVELYIYSPNTPSRVVPS
jgi:hypothetical protein